jgi:hypothetical protein
VPPLPTHRAAFKFSHNVCDEIELETTGFAWILRGAASTYTSTVWCMPVRPAEKSSGDEIACGGHDEPSGSRHHAPPSFARS